MFEVGQRVAHKSNPAVTGEIVEVINAKYEPTYIVKTDIRPEKDDWADHDTIALPTVGMGATICMWSDRHAATIVKVTRTQVHVQQDHAKHIGPNVPGGVQTYEYTRNPNAPIQVFRNTKRGYVVTGGGARLLIGVRAEHYDHSF